MAAKRRTFSKPGNALSDVTLEARQTAARYPINRGRAAKDAQSFDELSAKMRRDALARRAGPCGSEGPAGMKCIGIKGHAGMCHGATVEER
jgi:hypothetical protein